MLTRMFYVTVRLLWPGQHIQHCLALVPFLEQVPVDKGSAGVQGPRLRLCTGDTPYRGQDRSVQCVQRPGPPPCQHSVSCRVEWLVWLCPGSSGLWWLPFVCLRCRYTPVWMGTGWPCISMTGPCPGCTARDCTQLPAIHCSSQGDFCSPRALRRRV